MLGRDHSKSFVVQRALPNGNTRRVTIGATNVLSLAEARLKAESVLAEFYQGIDPKAGRRDAITLRQAFADYLEANKRLSDGSRKFYRKVIERHLSDWLDLPLKTITPEMVQGRHRKIAETVAVRGRYSGHAMANSTLTAFGVIYNFATESTPSLPPSPVKRLRRQWFDVPRRTRMVSADQLPVFYRAVLELESPIYRDVLLTMLFTGMRRGEATGLRWSEIDFAARMIRIPAARTKSRRAFNLPMSDFVHALLVSRRAIGKTDLVFPTHGKQVDPGSAFASIAEQTGITVSPHDLRRTYATVAESTAISPMELKLLVAHSVGSDVTSGYTIVSSERLREAAQKVCDKLKQLCGIEGQTADNVAKLK